MEVHHAELRQKIDEQIALLNRRISTLRTQYNHLAPTFRLRLQNLRTQRNRLAPISRLPVEIKIRIFSFAYNDNGVHIPLVLSAVSREWRDLALDLPELWARINNRLKLEHIPAYMARSRTKPLCMRFKDLTSQDTSFLSTIFQELHRVQEITIGMTHGISDNEFEELLSVPSPGWEREAPRLEKLWLDRFAIPRDIFSSQLPSLSHLVLVNCSFDWNSLPAFPQLSYLGILKPHDAISVEGFVQRLSSMPLITTIQIDALIGPGSEDVLELPNITTLNLGPLEPTVAVQLLQSLSLPGLNRLILSIKQDDPQDQLTVLNALDNSVSISTLPVQLLSIKARETSYGYIIQCEAIAILLQFHSFPCQEEDIHQILRRLKLSNLKDLRLDFMDIEETMEYKAFWSVFTKCDQLREITIRNGSMSRFTQILAFEVGRMESHLEWIEAYPEHAWMDDSFQQKTTWRGLQHLFVRHPDVDDRPEGAEDSDLTYLPASESEQINRNLGIIAGYGYFRGKCNMGLESLTIGYRCPLTSSLEHALMASFRRFVMSKEDFKTDLDSLFEF